MANLAKAAKLAQMGIRRELAKGLTKANVLVQRARGKRRIWQTLIKGFDESKWVSPKGPVESGVFGESGKFGENGEFGENLPKGLTKANELAQRAPWKAANLRKTANLANLAKLCQRV